MPDRCDRPPAGWACSRTAGHDGPCAAWPTGSPMPPDECRCSYGEGGHARTPTCDPSEDGRYGDASPCGTCGWFCDEFRERGACSKYAPAPAPAPSTERGAERWYVVGREAAQAAPNALDFSECITDLWGSPEFLMRDGRIVEAFSPEPEDKNLSRDYAPLIKLLNAQEGR